MSEKKYKCPYCNRRMTRTKMVRHIEKIHEEQIPEGYTPLRVTFNTVNNRPMDYCGICTECKGPTKWDEAKGRYDRQCGKKECHESYLRKFEYNSRNKNGYARLSENPQGMEKLLASRKISGKYTFSDGAVRGYTGSYERKALEFMDVVLNCKSDDIITPGPIFEYEYNGEKHIYISDILYVPYNLVIEVKDGGDRPNTRNMPEYRAKQIAKEKHIIESTEYNYLRLTNNDFSQLLAVMMDLKMQLKDNTGKRVIHVNENMSSNAISAMIPPIAHHNDIYIVNFMKKNNLSGETWDDYLVSESPMFNTIFYRNRDGILTKGDRSFLEDAVYNVYLVLDKKDSFQKEAFGKVGKFIDKGFIYESVFGKKLYTEDQIMTEQEARPVPDIYSVYESIKDMVRNSVLGDNDKMYMVESGNIKIGANIDLYGVSTCSYMRITDNHYIMEGYIQEDNRIRVRFDMNDENQRRSFRELFPERFKAYESMISIPYTGGENN